MNVGFGVAGLGWRDLVVTEMLEVDVLDGVGWRVMYVSFEGVFSAKIG